MKLIIILFIAGILQVTASVNTLKAQIDLSLEESTIKEVFQEIENQTEFTFLYNDAKIDVNKTVDIQTENTSIENVLTELLDDTEISYVVVGKQIVLANEDMIKGHLKETLNQQEEIEISGTIIDEEGIPLPGATIYVKGKPGEGTATDINGKYTIIVSGGEEILVFSYIGMKTQEVVIGGRSTIDITMQMELADLEEVVVIGYGTQKKVNLTGSVTAVKGEELVKRTVPDARLALQGAAPGFTIIDRGGIPGYEEVDLKIRGISSISGGSSPLVLIDGIEMSLKDINPSDIESISILKDAASSAIYGARGANGVILITTKRGKEGGYKVSYDGYLGWQTPATLPELVGAEDYLNLVNEALVNAGLPEKYSEEYIQNTLAGTDPINYPYTNLFEELYKTAPMNNQSIRVSGGTDMARMSLSLNYMDQDGMLMNVNSKKYGARLNTDFIINDKLKLRADLNFIRRNNVRPARLNGAINSILGSSPVMVMKYPDGTYGLNKDNMSTLAQLEVGGTKNTQTQTLNLKTGIDYQIIDDLKLVSDISYMTYGSRYKEFNAEYQFHDYENPSIVYNPWTPNTLYDTRWNEDEIYFKSLLDYSKKIEEHNFHVLAGFEATEHKNYYLEGKRQDIYSNNLVELNTGGTEGKDNVGYSEDWALASYFGRLNYSFKDRYLFEANFRYDGSSRFDRGHKWGFFPSFSVGWKMSEEAFIKPIDLIYNLKLRGSWGQLGNENKLSLFKYTSLIQPNYNYNFNDTEVTGYSQKYYANSDLTWETTEVTDIGLDLSLWTGKLELTVDWFDKRTKDVLLILPISYLTGLKASETNAGIVRNTGWEISITHKNKINEFGYSIGFNISDIKNELYDFADKEPVIDGWTILKEGEPLYALYGYKSDGLFQTQEEIDNHFEQPNHSDLEPGDIKLVDLNGDGIIDDEDRTVIGSTIPRYNMGINIGLDYKGFDLRAFMQGVFKLDNYFYGAPNEGPAFEIFTTTRVLDRWTPENTDGTFPRLEAASNKNNYLYNDFWIRDASYFRLKNLQIGYTLPKSITGKVNIDHVRFYVGGTNLFTITDIEAGLDPETYDGRPRYYPPVSTYLIGLQMTF